MDDTQLTVYLRSVGKACFIKYYNFFSDPELSNEDLVEIMKNAEGYTVRTCQSRISKSRQIIKKGRLLDALNMIVGSQRIEQKLVAKAISIKESLH
jgi:5'(3')-deoxyribonucleotidase